MNKSFIAQIKTDIMHVVKKAKNKLSQFIPFILFLVILGALLKLTHLLNHTNIIYVYSIRVSLIFICIGLIGQIFYVFVLQNNIKDRYKNRLLGIFTLVVLVFTLELIFMFIPLIHSSLIPHSSRIWLGYYWNPINNYGYRDNEINEREALNHKKIIILGDSFVAGQGIKTIENRFSNLLDKKLSEHYQVINLGQSGSDTRQQYKNLKKFPIKSNLVILSYFGNDIEDLIPLPDNLFEPYDDLYPVFQFLIRGSFCLDFIYWQLPHSYSANYTDLFFNYYTNNKVLKRHFVDLKKFIDLSKEENYQLVVVIFPFIDQIAKSKNYIGVITNFFSKYDVPVLDISQFIEPIPVTKLVVSRYDRHPSEYLHKLVADSLFSFLIDHGLISTDLPSPKHEI